MLYNICRATFLQLVPNFIITTSGDKIIERYVNYFPFLPSVVSRRFLRQRPLFNLACYLLNFASENSGELTLVKVCPTNLLRSLCSGSCAVI